MITVPDLDNTIAFSCDTDSNCLAGYVCAASRCVRAGGTIGCTDDFDCPSAAPVCDAGFCTDPCGSDPCAGAGVCSVDPTQVNGYRCDANCSNNTQCNFAEVCVTGAGGVNKCVQDCSSCPNDSIQKCVQVRGPNGTTPSACARCPSCGGNDVCQTQPLNDYDNATYCQPGCASNAECGGQICDLSSGQCVECLNALDCAPGYICDGATRTCRTGGAPCGNSAQCQFFEVCLAGFCIDPCAAGPCQGNVNQPFCFPDEFTPNGYTCETCIDDIDCPAQTPFCIGPPSQCVECIADAQCPGSTCNIGTYTCNAPAGCTSNAQCTDPARPLCDAATQDCVQCFGDTECAPGWVCDNGTCITPPGCTSNANCPPAAPICDTMNGACVQCVADADCGAGQSCDGANGVCMAGPPTGGVCATSAECAPGQVCDGAVCIDPCNPTNPCGDPNFPTCIADEFAAGFYRCTSCQEVPCGTGDVCVQSPGNLYQCVPACGSGCGSQGACLTVPGYTNDTPPVFSNTIAACKDCTSTCTGADTCQVQTAGTFYPDVTVGCTCNCGAEVCVTGSAGYSVCAPTCATLNSGCVDAQGDEGWCQDVPPASGGPNINVCVVCNNGSGCTGTDVCLMYEPSAAPVSTYGQAESQVQCACRPETPTPQWYALGTSACGGGVSNAPSGADVVPYFSGDPARGPSIAMAGGIVAVAYAQRTPQAYVKRFKPDTGWQGVATADGYVRTQSSGAGDSQQPALAMYGEVPLVTFRETSGSGFFSFVAQAPAGAGPWQPATTSPSTLEAEGVSFGHPDYSLNPALAVGPGGSVAVVFQAGPTNIEIIARSFTLGNPVNNHPPFPENGRHPSVAWIDGSGFFVAFTTDVSADTKVAVLGGSGNWTGLSNSLGSGGISNLPNPTDNPDIQLFSAGGNADPVVVFEEHVAQAVRIVRHNPGVWQGYGGTTEPNIVHSPARRPKLALQPGTDTPYVAYETGLERVHVKTLSGASNFTGLAGAAGSGGLGPLTGGVSQWAPSLAVGPSPRTAGREAVCVAWVQGTSPAQVYIRCHDL